MSSITNQLSGPDIITIKELFVEDVQATGAHIVVTVKGSSFVTGQTAVKKAREIAMLVEALRTVGLPEEKISVETIKIQASTGPVLKSSSASYTLKLDCDDIEQMGDILTVVTSSKNISLDSIEWQFKDLEKRKTGWIAKAIERANARVEDAARALQVQISGVHDCQIEYIGLLEAASHRDEYGGMSSIKMMRHAVANFNIGMPMQQTDQKGVRVTVKYHISK